MQHVSSVTGVKNVFVVEHDLFLIHIISIGNFSLLYNGVLVQEHMSPSRTT